MRIFKLLGLASVLTACGESATTPPTDAATPPTDVATTADVTRAEDRPAPADIPTAMDAPGAMDVPTATDAPTTVDTPTTVDAPTTADAPVGEDVVADRAEADASGRSVRFEYRPRWDGVVSVEVLGAFGRSDDWMRPLVTLTRSGDLW